MTIRKALAAGIFVTVLSTGITGQAVAGPDSSASPGHSRVPRVTLVGRAVLPVQTYAPGPVSGTLLPPGVVNGISFPLPSQPVEGFSAVIDGRRRGEYLAMPDNGYGAKATSKDFLIRAYYIRPDFKTRFGGTGTVAVGDFIRFRDPKNLIGFPIVNETTTRRLLTGGDIDPESLQRASNGDLWVGDEFGPWILHFSASGVLLDRPFQIPGVRSPNNPWLTDPRDATQPSSRGFEGMAISRDGKYLYAALEGATVADVDQQRRHIYQFSIAREELTGRTWEYRTSDPTHMIADMAALSAHRLLLIERDGGLGITALFRRVNVVNLRHIDSAGFVRSHEVVDLTAIPDPHLISLPAIHPGDIGLGNPFRVVCESVEALHPLRGNRLLVGCDNNFPNTGRNPGLADDSEFVVVKVHGLRGRTDS
jgi:hypothetical protein